MPSSVYDANEGPVAFPTAAPCTVTVYQLMDLNSLLQVNASAVPEMYPFRSTSQIALVSPLSGALVKVQTPSWLYGPRWLATIEWPRKYLSSAPSSVKLMWLVAAVAAAADYEFTSSIVGRIQNCVVCRILLHNLELRSNLNDPRGLPEQFRQLIS